MISFVVQLMNVECAKIESENNLCRQLAGNDHKFKHSKRLKSHYSKEYLLTPEEYKNLSSNVTELSFTDITRRTKQDVYKDNKLFENYYDKQLSNVKLL